MFCQYCGSEINDGSKFCKKCGQPTEIVSNVENKTEAVDPAWKTIIENEAPKKQKKKKPKIWLIILPIVLVVLLVLAGALAAAGYFVFTSSWFKEKKQLHEAKQYVEASDYENAVSAYETLLQFDDTNEEYYNTLIDLYEDWAAKLTDEGKDDEARKILEKELKLLETAYSKTNNENYNELFQELTERLKLPGTSVGLVVSDGEYDYFVKVVSDYDDTYSIYKKKKGEKLSSAKALVDEYYINYEIPELYLSDDRIYYFTDERYSLNWIDKDGKQGGTVDTDSILSDYRNLTDNGDNHSYIHHLNPYVSEYYFEEIYIDGSFFGREGGYSKHLIENDKMLFDSVFLIDLKKETIKSIAYPNSDKYYYHAFGLYQNKIYYVKFEAEQPGNSDSEIISTDKTDIYTFDLESQKEELLCSIDYNSRDVAEGLYYDYYACLFDDKNLCFIDEEGIVLTIDLENGKYDIYEDENDDFGDCTYTIMALEDNKLYFYDYDTDDYRVYDIKEKTVNIIPNSSKYDEYNYYMVWGVSGDDIYYYVNIDREYIIIHDSLKENRSLEDVLKEAGYKTDEVTVIEEQHNPKVGIAMPTKDLYRWNQDGTNLEKLLKEAGYDVDLQFASNDINTQVTQIENMITEGCKVLVIAAIDGDSLGTVLEQAGKKGIPVISYDRLIMNTDAVTYYITFDNYLVGQIQGKYIENELGLKEGNDDCNIEIFAGDVMDNNAKFFYAGAMDVLQPYIDNGQVTVRSGQIDFETVATEWYSTEKAQARMEAILAAYYTDDPLDAVLCPNDSIALGVTNAILANYPWAIPAVTGQDCDIANVKNIIAGYQEMSVFKDTRTLVSKTVMMVDAILKGASAPVNDTSTYDNGVKVVPSYLCEPIYVDVNNYREILIDSGYYSEDQISYDY